MTLVTLIALTEVLEQYRRSAFADSMQEIYLLEGSTKLPDKVLQQLGGLSRLEFSEFEGLRSLLDTQGYLTLFQFEQFVAQQTLAVNRACALAKPGAKSLLDRRSGVDRRNAAR